MKDFVFLFGYRLIRYKLAPRSPMTFSFSHFSAAASYKVRNRTFKYFTGKSSIHIMAFGVEIIEYIFKKNNVYVYIPYCIR